MALVTNIRYACRHTPRRLAPNKVYKICHQMRKKHKSKTISSLLSFQASKIKQSISISFCQGSPICSQIITKNIFVRQTQSRKLLLLEHEASIFLTLSPSTYSSGTDIARQVARVVVLGLEYKNNFFFASSE